MAWERYVGRVGALAVALGIGSAVAAIPAVASAQSDDTPSADASAGPTRESTDKPVRKRVFGTKREAATAGDRSVASSSAGRQHDPVSPTDEDTEPARDRRLFKPLFAPRAAAHDDKPEPPAATPLLWTMVTAARRHSAEQGSDAPTRAAASSTVQASAPTEIDGAPNGSVVVGANGTAYQVATGAGGTRVSIVDNTGHVLATSNPLTGKPNLQSQAVVRPDGSLVIVTSNDRGTRSTAWSVDSEGSATKIATFGGSPSGKPAVGADGALYLDTYYPTIFSPSGSVDYRAVRISSTNTVRSFAPDTSVTLAVDGSAYLLSSQFGIRTLRAFGADGATKTMVLPYEKSGSAPILGEDGYVYLPVGVRTVFGGKTTRVYTLRGAQSTTRTVTGLPGSVVVKNDGVYLETHTYPGTTDNGVDGTTSIYKITPSSITVPRLIDGRLRSFQVSAEGTIYAVINDSASTPVVVISPDGTSRSTVTLPGTNPPLGGVNRILGDGEQADDHGYVTYVANGSTYLAVLDADGSVDRTIALPAGTVAGNVFFGPDGAAYLLSQERQLGGAATAQVLLTLSNDTFSPVLPGPALTNVSDVQFGSDGGGYLILRNDPDLGNRIVGFDASGLTGVELTLTDPVATPYGSVPVNALVFGPDGTAYVASGAPGDAGVYALTATGVTKVLDLDGTPPQYLPVVGPDGTVYVTTATADGVTTVRTVVRGL